MSITPEEIEEKAFRERFRGYDPVDVDQFLDDIATAFRDVLAQHGANAARMRELEELARGDVGGLMHRTMAEVERITADARNRAKQELERARRDARELLDHAEISAQKTLAAARERAQREEQQLKRQAVEARHSAQDTLRTSRDQAQRELEQARVQIDRVRTAVTELDQFRASYEDRLQSIVSEQFGVFERIYQLLSLPELPRELRNLNGVSGDVDQALAAMGQHGTNGQQPEGVSPHDGDAPGHGDRGTYRADEAPGAAEGVAEPEDTGENAAAI